MAKGKKHHSRKHSRRRVSGTGTDLKTVGLQLAGAVVANKLAAMLRKPKADGTANSLAMVAPYTGLLLGFGLPMISKDSTVKSLASGMMISGGLEVLKQFAPGLVSGVFTIPVVAGRKRMGGGVQNPNAIGAGYTPARNSATDIQGALSVISGAGMCN